MTNEEFEEEFRDELMTLIEDRPYKETNKVKFMKNQEWNRSLKVYFYIFLIILFYNNK